MTYKTLTPNLSRAIARIDRDNETFSQEDDLFAYFENVKRKPTPLRLCAAFTLARILGREPDQVPVYLPTIVAGVSRDYQDLSVSGTGLIRRTWRTELPESYRSEDVSLRVYDLDERWTRVKVNGNGNDNGDGKPAFVASLPSRFFGNTPKCGNKYRAVNFDLFGKWHGLDRIALTSEFQMSDGQRERLTTRLSGMLDKEIS